MNRILSCAIVLIIYAAATVSCSSAPAPVAPTHASFVLPTLIPPTKIPPTATAVPTATFTPLPPTQSPVPTAPVAATATVEVTSQVSPTTAPPTATPTRAASPTLAASLTPAVAAGVYITGLRIDPSPVRGTALKFIPTFLNSMLQEQNFRWAVYIFKADTQRGIGETSRTDAGIPTGTTELISDGSWQWPLGGPCDYFYAQVGWTNAENKVIWFNATSGSVFQKGFTACPP